MIHYAERRFLRAHPCSQWAQCSLQTRCIASAFSGFAVSHTTLSPWPRISCYNEAIQSKSVCPVADTGACTGTRSNCKGINAIWHVGGLQNHHSPVCHTLRRTVSETEPQYGTYVGKPDSSTINSFNNQSDCRFNGIRRRSTTLGSARQHDMGRRPHPAEVGPYRLASSQRPIDPSRTRIISANPPADRPSTPDRTPAAARRAYAPAAGCPHQDSPRESPGSRNAPHRSNRAWPAGHGRYAP